MNTDKPNTKHGNGTNTLLPAVAPTHTLSTDGIALDQAQGLSGSAIGATNPDDPELIKRQIRKALIKQHFYNPYNVFHHSPEFHECEDKRYVYKIHIVKWNTRSTRMTILYAKFNTKKQKWVFARKPGVPRYGHGEQMR